MAEGEVIINSDVAMSPTDQDDSDGALSDEASQHSQNNVLAETSPMAEENNEVTMEIVNKHSDDEGQLSTDNDDEASNHSPQNVTNGKDNNGENYPRYNPPVNAYNGNLEYKVSPSLLVEVGGLDQRLYNIRKTAEHLISQMCMFNEGLPDDENFDIDEFSATLMEMSTVLDELYGISNEFNKIHEKLKEEALQCLDKYEEKANIHGGYLLNAKMNKSRQIRNFIQSWQAADANLDEDQHMDSEEEANFIDEFYDNSHNYQLLARSTRRPTWEYVYEPELPILRLPLSFHVAPTAHLPQNEEMFHPLMPSDSDEMYSETIQNNLIPSALPSLSELPPPQRVAEAIEPLVSANDSPNVTPGYVPPMISQAPTMAYNTPPASVAPVSLPPMNLPPPVMTIPSLPLAPLIPTSILPPEHKSKKSQFQKQQPHSNSVKAPVLIPGLNIAGTAPLFAQVPITGSPTPIKPTPNASPSLIPIQIPTAPLPSAKFGVDNYRKSKPQIAPIINFNPNASPASASNSLSSNIPATSSHIPSLLDINVAFPIEILKFNQTQAAQQQRFTNRNRRSPIVNTEPKEKESQSVKSEETTDFSDTIKTEMDDNAESKSNATPIDEMNDFNDCFTRRSQRFFIQSMYPQVYSTDGVYVQPAIYLPIRSVNGYLTYYPHPVSASMTPPLGTPISSYYATSPLTIMSNGAVSPIPNGALGEGPAQMRKLFIGGLNHETTDEQLREYYSQWGAVVDCIVIRDPITKHSRGFGFVTYATIQMAETAMNGRPHTINGKVVDPKRAIPREQMLPMTATNPPYFLESEPQQECKIVLSGIHWDYHTVDGLRQHFENFGSVEQVEILGHPRGFGFIVFEDKDGVSKCKSHGRLHSINGKKVEVRTDPSLDLPTAASVYIKRRHNLSGSQGYGTQQESSTATPDSFCSTEYTSSSSVKSDQSDTNILQITPTF